MALRADLIGRLDNALTKNSNGQYRSGVRAFLNFLLETDNIAEHVEFPLNAVDAALYTSYLLKRHKPGSVRTYRSHLNFFCDMIGVARPAWNELPQMKRVFAQVNRMAKTTKKKLPITMALAQDIVDACDMTSDTDRTCSFVLLLAIVGLFRLGELLVRKATGIEQHKILRRDHVTFIPSIANPTHMEIFLQYSKTDKFGVGCTIFIPCHPDVRYCPVRMMREIIKRLEKPTDPIFTWPSNGKFVTTGAFIKWLRNKLHGLGIDDSRYAGHSCRRGGAITAKMAGASAPLIKALGRWTSEAFQIYLRLIPPRVEHLNDLLAAMMKMQG